MRNKVIALGLVVAIVVALWSAGWLWAADQLKTQIAALAQNDGESAPQLTCGASNLGGWPFGFDFSCDAAVVTTGDLSVQAGGLRAQTLVYDLPHVIFSLKGPVTVADAYSGSQSRVDFSALNGSVHMVARDFLQGVQTGEGWRIGRISLVGDGVSWTDTTAAEYLRASAAHAEVHLIDVPGEHDAQKHTATLAEFATVTSLKVPGWGIADGGGTFESKISGLPDDLEVLANDPEALKHWQQAGGVLTLLRFTGSEPTPATSFDASGQATLTDAGLLNADLNYTSQGLFARFSDLIPGWQVPLFEGPAQANGVHQNSLHMENGQMKLLTFTLLNLPPLF